jgi:MFS family permease
MTTLLGRLDMAGWNRVHTAITAALGVGWLLDAFEVTIVNNVIAAFRDLWHLTNLQSAWILSIWFVGIMVGAYLFGYLADRFGRKPLFLLTLLLYGIFTFLTAFAWGYGSFMESVNFRGQTVVACPDERFDTNVLCTGSGWCLTE